jgi:hypothetical protein
MLQADNVPAVSQPKRFKTIKSSNYDINNTCNLTCEGCYYFVSGQKTLNKRPSAKDYDAFFRSEAERGVNYPIFSGGEPSLNPAALKAAARYWSGGIIYTNGVRKIPEDIPFRVAISVWGGRVKNELLRGASSYQQAFETARGDPRAMIYFTISRGNIDDIEEVVRDCVAQGLKVSFNAFSMTSEYMRLLENGSEERSVYFRFSTENDNLSLRRQDRQRAADIIDRLIDLFPDSIVFSKLLSGWMLRTDEIHDVDPLTKIATDCAMLNAAWHKSFNFDLKQSGGKPCCAPEFDCRDCRVGPVATFTLLTKLAVQMRSSAEARRDFIDLRDLMMRYHYWDWAFEQPRDPIEPPLRSAELVAS